VVGFTTRVLVIAVLVDLVFYLLFLGTLRSRVGFENHGKLQVNCVDRATLALTGKSQPTGKSSSVCHFPEAKPPGALRIGCFGDSFTYSFEVEDELDYPALLGRLFRNQGLEHVEVLNLGNDWFGFHQARILFDSLGPRYGLDVAVFGPQSAYEDRDTTFCHSERDAPGFVHARYVLDGEGVRLVGPRGGVDTIARFTHYNSFVPHIWALLYDRRPPAFLRALIPEPLRDRVANPFYYLSPAERQDEVHTLYARLLANIPPETRVVVGLYDTRFVQRLARDLPARIDLEALPMWDLFPYKSAGYHNSPTGNLLLATLYYNLLALGEPIPPVVIETADLEPAASLDRGDVRPLHDFDEVWVAMADQRVGGFVSMVPAFMAGNLSPEEQQAWQRGVIEPDILQRLGTVALLALKPSGSTLPDAAFLPLLEPLRAGSTLDLRCAGAAEVQPLATVRLVAPQLGVVEIGGGYRAFHAQRSAWRWPEDAVGDCREPDGSELLVDGQPVLRFERAGPWGSRPGPSGGLEAVPVEGPLLLLRAVGDALLEPEQEQSGLVELMLQPRDGPVQRHTIARWYGRALGNGGERRSGSSGHGFSTPDQAVYGEQAP
jgi:hypothetical protein